MNEYLSETELFYSSEVNEFAKEITLESEEYRHAIKVMRHKSGDIIHITDGEGKIYGAKITGVFSSSVKCKIENQIKFENYFKNIFFCIPILKNPDRLKFALEKSVELGITNFILFSSQRTIGKLKLTERLNKVMISAMKQSLRSYLPHISLKTFNEITDLKSKKILFDQNVGEVYYPDKIIDKPCYFIFGPEGGFDKDELEKLAASEKYKLSAVRLRSETAVIVCASLIQHLKIKSPEY